MSRVEIGEVVFTGSGVPLAGASVQVNERDAGAATVYAAEAGGTTVTNPIVTDTYGRIEGWLETGSYDLVVSGSGVVTYTQRFEAVSGSDAGGGGGSGVPNGGTTNEVLTKLSSTDGDADWEARAIPLTINAQTGTTYTFVLADGSVVTPVLVELANASPITATIPPNSSVAFPVGTVLLIGQAGAGQVTIAAGVGVTIRTPNGAKTAQQWSQAAATQRAANDWIISGDTST